MNLIPNANFEDLDENGIPYGFTKIGNGTLNVSNIPIMRDIEGNKLVIIGDGNETGISYNKNVRELTDYTVGVFYKSTGNVDIKVKLEQYNGTLLLDTKYETLDSNSYVRIYRKLIRTLKTVNNIKLIITIKTSSTIEICFPSLEVGDKVNTIDYPYNENSKLTIIQ